MTMFLREAGFAIATAAALALTAVPANATYFGSRDGPAIGIGAACAGLMAGVARNPSLRVELTDLYRDAASAILAFHHSGQKDVPQGIALYKVGQLEGLGRNPAISALLTTISDECGDDLRALRPARPDRAAVAIGEMCYTLLTGIAENPSALTALLAAYNDGVDRIAALKPRSSSQVKAEAFGRAAAGHIEGFARNPSLGMSLASAATTCEHDIRAN